MTLKSTIKDGHNGNNATVGVTEIGELIVNGYAKDDLLTAFNSLTVINTAFNFFIPLSGQEFVITSIFFDTPAAATNIDIYESSSVISIVVDKTILHISTSGKNFFPITFPFGGFPTVTEGKFLNAKTDNATVNMTIMGYYAPTT